jgi:hypothetical protein
VTFGLVLDLLWQNRGNEDLENGNLKPSSFGLSTGFLMVESLSLHLIDKVTYCGLMLVSIGLGSGQESMLAVTKSFTRPVF